MKTSTRLLCALCAIFFAIIACSPAPTVAPDEFVPPTPSIVPTMPPTRQLTLVTTELSEIGTAPDYTITLSIPKLEGTSDIPNTQVFNDLATSIVTGAVDEFKASLVSLPDVPELQATSSFSANYTLQSMDLEMISVKIEMEGYVKGMAHPYHLNRTLTFDLKQGAEVTLASLFLPGSDYLTVIANFCATELKTRDIGFDDEIFSQGAAPTPENYHNWNITPEGLLITFDEYQVAPYAAGPQTVLIPYAELATLIDPQGALAKYRP